jgi:regulator of nonsense transcripts 1
MGAKDNLGISTSQDLNASPMYFVLATSVRVLLIQIDKKNKQNHNYARMIQNLLELEHIKVCGINLWADALVLYGTLGFKINTFHDMNDKQFKKQFKADEKSVNWPLFKTNPGFQYAALRAFLMNRYSNIEFGHAKPLMMYGIEDWILKMCYETYKTYKSLAMVAERWTDVDFDANETKRKGGNQLIIKSDRFKTRLRRNQVLEVKVKGGKTVKANTVQSRGKTSIVKTDSSFQSKEVLTIRIDNSNDVSDEDKRMQDLLKDILYGKKSLSKERYVFIQALFNPKYKINSVQSNQEFQSNARLVNNQGSLLNQSQKNAIANCLTKTPFMNVIHGPPGTGKTTVISNFIKIWDLKVRRVGEQAICTARSNIAVKNIAESFVKNGFLNFAILVSDEFYWEWHEHLYKDDEIHSRLFPTSVDTSGFRKYAVVLCTLATVAGYDGLVKVTHLVIDEASQIFIGNYLSPLIQLTDLKKVIFFGDDKQLAPYGSSTVKVVSVFELPLVKMNRVTSFLDT